MSGGQSGAEARADSIDFTGAANQLTPGAGLLTGDVAVTGSLAVHTAGANVTLANAIMDYTAGAGSASVDGGGVLTVSGANTYTGATTISAGALRGGAANVFSAASAVTDDATLDLGGFNQVVGALSGGGSVTNSGAAAATLTTGGLNQSPTFSGVIKDGTATTALDKVGAGTLSLAGANTFTGGATVDGGVLRAAHVTNGVIDALGANGGTFNTSVTVRNATLEFSQSGTLANNINLGGDTAATVAAVAGSTATLTGSLSQGVGSGPGRMPGSPHA